jgi:pimeloyl-ACP methyl ester carboxylesterase
LPGLTVSGAFFEALAGAGLCPRFRALALDLRGRGRSDAPPAEPGSSTPALNYTMADHAADVLVACEALSVRRPVLVGHSFGGMLALYLAAHAPALFPRVVVIDAAASLASPATRELLRPVLDRLDQVKPSWEEYLAALKRQPYFQGWWDPAIEAYFRDDVWADRDGRVRSRARPDAVRAAVEGLLAVEWPAVLARVTRPVLLLNAVGSFGPPGTPPFLTPAGAMATAGALADCRYVPVSGNHLTVLFGDNARRVAAAIVSFVEGDAGGPGPLACPGGTFACSFERRESSLPGAAVAVRPDL